MSSSPARYFPGVLLSGKRTAGRDAKSADDLELGDRASDNAEEIHDDLLMARLQAQDVQALGLLYQRYARIVYSVGFRVLRDSTEAEDLVHEVFLSLYRKCKSFDPAKGAARSWIIQLTYSRCFDLRDHLKARHNIGQGIDMPDATRSQAVPLSLSQSPDPAYFVLWNASMVAAFNSLSREQRESLHLFYFKGYTFKEIAEETGDSYGNVKHHVYRGIQRLRELVYDNGQQPPQEGGEAHGNSEEVRE